VRQLPNVLLIGTVPYNPSTQARALMSYFGFWADKKENAAQIFSDSRLPVHGFCKTFYQITDEMLLEARLHHRKNIGEIYWDSSLSEAKSIASKGASSHERFRLLKKLKNHKGPLEKLLRKHLWARKYWQSEKLLRWADDFKPDVVYCSFSDDFFILQMSLFFAKRYRVPLLLQIGDDYYFQKHFSCNPFYWIYRSEYKRLVRKLYAYDTHIMYSSEKIQSQYKTVFPNDSAVVYISSDFPQSQEIEHSEAKNHLLYVGNTKLGRDKAIAEVGSALYRLNPNFGVDVYSPENDPKILKRLQNAPGVFFHGSLEYSKVQETTLQASTILIAESFSKKDIKTTIFSLSTKVADGLAAGIPIFAYGPSEAGFMHYLLQEDCACCCTAKDDLPALLQKVMFDHDYRLSLSQKELAVAQKNHRQAGNSALFYDLVERTCHVKEL
jgi:glycosyltransferase involved in cell wall biosynthesis